jgi:hypothetical protein
MKACLKKSWWKVPLYCIAASRISFRLKVRIGAAFAISRLPDGTVSIDNTRWMVMSGVVFVVFLLLGGLLFRKMSRQEVFYSASVMVVFNVIGGLISYFFQRTALGSSFAVFYSELHEWSGFVSQFVYDIGLNQWIGAVIVWAVPYLFVFFGKRLQDEKSTWSNGADKA